MKKLFFTFLTLVLFVSVGMAQNLVVKAADIPTVRAEHKVVPVAKKQAVETTTHSTSKKGALDNLKNTDAAKYKAYLSALKDISTLKACLANKSLNPVERKELESKIRLIESGLKTKFGL